MYTNDDFIMVPVPLDRFTAVCALLGGASAVAVAAASLKASVVASPTTVEPSAPSDNGASGEQSSTSTIAPTAASPSDAPAGVDTGGHPWNAELHASTGTKTKDGYWRMKVGVTRPADLPGFPKDGVTGTNSAAQAAAPVSGAATFPDAGPADDEDEFAAFRQAAGGEATAPIPARKWTDADLGSLCNQAAVKLGSPEKIKALIAAAVPAGEVPHSRNIPDDKRAQFAADVEAAAGITFAG